MKQKLSGFIAGVITTVLALSLIIPVLATTGKYSIDVYPINVQVDGATFQPTDANGNSVSVFNYNGTTYAPLRALAEAYGLEVGYDSEKNMATVTSSSTDTTAPSSDYSDWTAEEEAAYQEFKTLWEIEDNAGNSTTGITITAKYNGKTDGTTEPTALQQFRKKDYLFDFVNRFSNEIVNSLYNAYQKIYFGYSTDNKMLYGGLIRDITDGRTFYDEIQIN